MKKIIFYLLITVLTVGNAYCQHKKLVALIPPVAGKNVDKKIRKIVLDTLQTSMANSNYYAPVTHDDNFQQLLKEFELQNNVTDEQAKAFARALNADYVCCVYITKAKDYRVTYVLMDAALSEKPRVQTMTAKNDKGIMCCGSIISRHLSNDEYSEEEVEIKPKFNDREIYTFFLWIYENLKFEKEWVKKTLDRTFEKEWAKKTPNKTIYCSFLITPEGIATDVKITPQVDTRVEQTIINLISNSSKWTSGEYDGKKVSVRYNVPIPLEGSGLLFSRGSTLLLLPQ